MKSQFIEIKTTFSSNNLAKKLCKKLIESKLVACAQVSKIQSLYIFEGKFVNQNEILVTLKTKKRLYHKIKKAIIRLHEYKSPQIISFKIDDIDSSYMEWIKSSVKDR